MYGVGRELTKAEELLNQMRDAQDEQAEQRFDRRDAVQQQEQKKLDVGKKLVKKATSAGAVIISEEDNTDEEETKWEMANKKKGSLDRKPCKDLQKGDGALWCVHEKKRRCTTHI